MNHFPKLLSSQIGFDVAQTMLEGFDRHYRIFRDAAIHAKTLFEAGGLARPAKARARAHHFVRRARRGMRRTARRRIRRGKHRRRSVAADQAALHRPVDHAPPARVRGDVFQFGVLQDPAPLVFQQRLHFRAPGDLDRIHRERRAGREADLSRVLSRQGRPRRDARTHRHELPAGAAVRRPDARRRLRDAGDPRRVRRVRRSAQLPDSRALVAVLPEQVGVYRRTHHQRRSRCCRSRCRCVTSSRACSRSTRCCSSASSC